MNAVSVKQKGNILIIELPMNTENPPVSSSGKTLMVAGTSGSLKTDITVKGKQLVVGVNAYIKAN